MSAAGLALLLLGYLAGSALTFGVFAWASDAWRKGYVSAWWRKRWQTAQERADRRRAVRKPNSGDGLITAQMVLGFLLAMAGLALYSVPLALIVSGSLLFVSGGLRLRGRRNGA